MPKDGEDSWRGVDFIRLGRVSPKSKRVLRNRLGAAENAFALIYVAEFCAEV